MRRGRKVRSFEDGSRDTLGEYNINQAVTRLQNAARAECSMAVRSFGLEELVPMFWSDDVMATLRAAAPYVDGTAWGNTRVPYTFDATIDFFFHGVDGVTIYPNSAGARFNPERGRELAEGIETISGIWEKWAAVIHVLKWFNKNATAGAIRAIWPAVLELCKDSPALKDLAVAPARYQEPSGLSKILPLVRETAGTVASLTLMPPMSALPQPINSGAHVSLTFAAGPVIRDGIAFAAPTFIVALGHNPPG